MGEQSADANELSYSARTTEKNLISARKKYVAPITLTLAKIKSGSNAHALDAKVHNTVLNNTEESNLIKATICDATGAASEDVGEQFLLNCINASGLISIENIKDAGKHSTTILNALYALKPSDEIEGMLITRLVSLHFQIMHFMSKTVDKEQTTYGKDLNINRSAKLTRIYNETLDTLLRYRRKGEQKFVVQHVNVNDGGKAIVNGNINTSPGEGAKTKNKEPHER